MNQDEDVKIGVFKNWVMVDTDTGTKEALEIGTEVGAPPIGTHASLPVVEFDHGWVVGGNAVSRGVIDQRRQLFLPQYPLPQPDGGSQKLSNLIRTGAPLWSGQSIGAWTKFTPGGGRYACALSMALSALGRDHGNVEALNEYLGFRVKTTLCGYPHHYDVWKPVDRDGNVARDKPRVYGSIPIVVQYLNDAYGWNPGKISRWLEGIGL